MLLEEEAAAELKREVLRVALAQVWVAGVPPAGVLSVLGVGSVVGEYGIS